ncbi:hypothetical protein IQ247_20595 [Plectonema cf. radiosum LEGE 06105]|uniref:Uncharacterized protein n=1 Tax=Plectonema cf. radiosum LEGE 06105 TaxID=945769 RepID=A0A8J7JVY2_9CYAN|nr:hypothetical protein [Plectonema radiosum]MBE9215035.1 hypothetical protein [Plectonema cf. radiosum LEGE 06105]
MTMLFDIEQYRQPNRHSYECDWDSTVYDPAWDELDDFPEISQNIEPVENSNEKVSTAMEVLDKDGEEISLKIDQAFNDNSFRQVWHERKVLRIEDYVWRPLQIYMNPFYSCPPSTEKPCGEKREHISPSISPSTRFYCESQTKLNNSLLFSTTLNSQVSNDDNVLGVNTSPSTSPSTQLKSDSQTQQNGSFLSTTLNIQVSNDDQMLGVNISPSTFPSTRFYCESQTKLDDSLLFSITLNFQVSNDDEVLGGHISPSTSPSTQLQSDSQTQKYSLFLSTTSNIQVSNDDKVLGRHISPSTSPSTQLQSESQTKLDDSLLFSNDSNAQVSNNERVLGENTSSPTPPSTHRKPGEGSGNLSWGYANANSTKKKPIKQLYFEWEYGGKRGKTYVRSHFKEQVISMNEAKVPVIEILKLLTYNPKVARILGVN